MVDIFIEKYSTIFDMMEVSEVGFCEERGGEEEHTDMSYCAHGM